MKLQAKFIFGFLLVVITIQPQEIICKKKKLWEVKTNLKKYEKVLPQVDKLIKRLRSKSIKKSQQARKALSKIGGNVISYLIKKFRSKNLGFLQFDELKRYYEIINQQITQIGIGCSDEEGNILWYAMLKGKTNKATILIGVNDKVIYVHSITDNKYNNIEKWNIFDIVCRKNGEWEYILEISDPSSTILLSQEKIHSDAGHPGKFAKNEKAGRYALIFTKRNKKQVAIIDGKKSTQEYDQIYSLKFSPDGKMYILTAKKGQKDVVEIEGQKSIEVDGISSPILFSYDGTRYALRIQKGKKFVILMDGKESKEYDEIDVNFPPFLPNSNIYYYLAKEDNKWVVVIDGKESKKYDKVEPPIFTKDKKRYAFLAKKGKKWVAVVDGKEGVEYDEIYELTFSPDGKRYGYIAKRQDKYIAVIDDIASKEYDAIYWLTFSFDGKRYAFGAKKKKKWVIVIDGKESEEYPFAYEPTFSRNGKRFGFCAQKGRKYIAVIDGIESKKYDWVQDIVFSSNSEKYGFKAKIGNKWIMVINGKESKKYKRIRDLIFSPDGKRYGFVASKGKKRIVVIDGKEYLKFHIVKDLTFSENSKHFSFFAKIKDDEFIIIDGKAYKMRSYFSVQTLQEKELKTVLPVYDGGGEAWIINFQKTPSFEKISEPFLIKSKNQKQKPKIEFIGTKHKKIYRLTCSLK